MPKKPIKEFDFIESHLAPLTNGFRGALNLTDDIAIIPKDSRTDYVITLDTIAEDSHFLNSATPEQIARKLFGSNLSDIASAGATPKFYLMTGNLAKDMDSVWLKRYVTEIAKIQKKYGIILLGGDTVRTKGKKFFSLTVMGEVAKGKALLRKGAKPGDSIYVSGRIGEAWLGLQILQKNISVPKARHKYFIDRHYAPVPQIELGKSLVNIATSCTDISDGLLKDLTNILKTSKVSAIIEADKIPLGISGKKYLLEQITGGDDYHLVFTAPSSVAKKLTKQGIVCIGKVVKSDKQHKLTIIDSFGKEIKYDRSGYEH